MIANVKVASTTNPLHATEVAAALSALLARDGAAFDAQPAEVRAAAGVAT